MDSAAVNVIKTAPVKLRGGFCYFALYGLEDFPDYEMLMLMTLDSSHVWQVQAFPFFTNPMPRCGSVDDLVVVTAEVLRPPTEC